MYSFATSGADGSDPRAGLVVDAAGNLYSTTYSGGAIDAGTVFKLAPPSVLGGAWTYSLLHSFVGGPDGAYPAAPVLLKNGALYGLTTQGGDKHCFADLGYTCGTLFTVKP